VLCRSLKAQTNSFMTGSAGDRNQIIIAFVPTKTFAIGEN
jgi:hypothetical protein